MQQRHRRTATTMCVLSDRSRSGYAIVHGVCVCAAPVRDRIHAEDASIGETVFKMSPPFGTLALDYTNVKHIIALRELQARILERRSAGPLYLSLTRGYDRSPVGYERTRCPGLALYPFCVSWRSV
jgi:hypothetical protein